MSAASTPARPSIVPRKTVLDDKYQLLAPVGMGETATVWKATVLGAAGFQRTVAVKRILPQLRGHEATTERFVAEARIGAELSHHNIVAVYDFCGSPDHGYFLVMEWVEGCAFSALIESFSDERTPWEELTFAVAMALNGLNDAHEHTDAHGAPRPIIHRDVCPDNILVGVRGEVKLTDFGLAPRESDADAAPLGVNPLYVAPEVLDGAPPDERTDVYSTGVVLWEALAGHNPFAELEDGVLDRIRGGAIPPIDGVRDDLPATLVDIVTRAVAKDRDARPPSAWDFAEELFTMLREDAGPYLKPRLGMRVRRYQADRDPR